MIKDDKLIDGYEKNAFKDRGSWYPVILDGYIEYYQHRKLLVTPVQNVLVHRVWKTEGV